MSGEGTAARPADRIGGNDVGLPPLCDTEADALDFLQRALLLKRLAQCFAYPCRGHREALLAHFATARSDDALAPLLAAWRTADYADLCGEYCRLFLGTAPCPPNETSWGDGARFAGVAAELSDLQGMYHAFGFALAADSGEMPDHVCVELEFLAALLLKIAYARLRGWEEAQAVAAEATRDFLGSHLGRWPGAFARRLHELNARSPWREAGDALDTAVSAECERFNVRPAHLHYPAGTTAEPEAFACPHDSSRSGRVLPLHPS